MGDPIVTAGDAATAALVNQFVATPEGKSTVFIQYGRILYNGTSWEVHASTDNVGLGSAVFTWDTNKLNMSLTGFASRPMAMVSPISTSAAYEVKAHGKALDEVQIRFFDIDTGAMITTEDANMDFNLLLIGPYTV